MKIIDRYIISRFLGTFFLAIVLLLAISITIDLSQRTGRLAHHGGTVWGALTQYYPYWSLWMGNTFMPIVVFISIIFFTARLTNNTEIVAMSAGGVSMLRLLRPYLISALVIGGFSFSINHFLLPEANRKRNAFLYTYLISISEKERYFENKRVYNQINPGIYLFINSYNRLEKNGLDFTYQQYDVKGLLKHSIRAEKMQWLEKEKRFKLTNYSERRIENQKEFLDSGQEKHIDLNVDPEDILPESYAAENKNTFELKKFIALERSRGSGQINLYLNELYQRTALPFSTFILTILALAISSRKKRGGVGVDISIGITLAFVYIFFMEVSKTFSASGSMPSIVAVWMSNVLFGLLSMFLFWRRMRT